MRKLIYIFFFLVFLLFPKKILAADYFTTSYKVTYDIKESGTTHATINVVLVNTSEEYYASSYKIQVGFPTIKNVAASDPLGQITPKVSRTDDGNLIDVTFNKHVVGKGNSLSYTIQFDTPDVAHKQGQVWEIDIPGLADQEAFDTFNVAIKTPPSFGTPSYIKPVQPTKSMNFTKEQLGKSGISIAYGEKQTYDFALTYHLENKNVFPIRTEIALPPNTNYQDVYLTSLDPKPQNVHVDADGNWLATYRLASSEKINVQAKGYASLFLTPKASVLSDKERQLYTAKKPYWETDSEEIKKLAQKLQTPRAIYDYLIQNLSYDFSRIDGDKPRLGGKVTLNQKDSAACLEFTDLFITLARAAGIPAREVDGFAYTQNEKQRPLSLAKDILHAWPEYYDNDKKAWVMIDPTWGNTTGGVDYFDVLDFDHFAFVIRGADSQYPIPAGGYKYEGSEEKKDVYISLPEVSIVPAPLSISLQTNEKPLFSFVPLKVLVEVKNTSQTLLKKQVVRINSITLKPSSQTVTVPEIPPFGSVIVPVSFEKVPLLTNQRFDFTIEIAGKKITQTITILPLFLSPVALVIEGAIVVILTIIILIIARRARRIPIS